MTTSTRPTIGLALGAGASRGWAHIGVIRRLEEAGIFPDVVCGTSAGSVVGGFYAAGELDFLEDWVRNLSFRRMLGYVHVRRDRSLFGRKLLRQLAEQGSHIAVDRMALRFAAIATDLASGREVRIEEGSLMKAVAASSACPGLLPPVKIGNRWLIDGALTNPVPVSTCRALGAQLVIAVDLFGSRRRDLSPPSAGSGRLAMLSKLVPRGLARSLRLKGLRMCRAVRYGAGAPNVLAVAMRSASLLQRLLGRTGGVVGEPDLLIEPELVPMLGRNQAAVAIEAGREAAERALSALQDARFLPARDSRGRTGPGCARRGRGRDAAPRRRRRREPRPIETDAAGDRRRAETGASGADAGAGSSHRPAIQRIGRPFVHRRGPAPGAGAGAAPHVVHPE